MMPSTFQCPDNMRFHLGKVFEGEYDIPLVTDTPMTIIDIGANCGAFAVWAAQRWPTAQVLCYEPNPEAFSYLEKNTLGLPIYAKQAAITGIFPGTTHLFQGKNNLGEASLLPCEGQTSLTVEVPTMPPRALPTAHILKIDAEGAELEILHWLISVEGRSYSAIMLEYHSDKIRRMLDALLGDYRILKADIATHERGTLCYVNKDFFTLEI